MLGREWFSEPHNYLDFLWKKKPSLIFVRFGVLDNHHDFQWREEKLQYIFSKNVIFFGVRYFRISLLENSFLPSMQKCCIKNSRHVFSSYWSISRIFIENNVLGAEFGTYR